jgi:hypothetical protein
MIHIEAKSLLHTYKSTSMLFTSRYESYIRFSHVTFCQESKPFRNSNGAPRGPIFMKYDLKDRMITTEVPMLRDL